MWDKLIDLLHENWPAIQQNPFPYVSIFGAGVAIGYAARAWKGDVTARRTPTVFATVRSALWSLARQLRPLPQLEKEVVRALRLADNRFLTLGQVHHAMSAPHPLSDVRQAIEILIDKDWIAVNPGGPFADTGYRLAGAGLAYARNKGFEVLPSQ